MKRQMKYLALFLVLWLITPKAFSQDVSTQGTEFWVSFMGNGFKENNYPAYVDTQLLISAKRDCTGTVVNPQTGWSKAFDVQANDITLVDIPNAQGYNETYTYESVDTKGLKVITSDTVTVYCTNIASNSFDASFVLPLQALSDDYIIQTYDQSTSYGFSSDFASYLTSAFLIVGTEDNTTVDITTTVNTLGGKAAEETFSITLQAGETYQVRSTDSGNRRDLTGTRVTARDCKPIAVFNGNTLTTVPNLSNGYDHIFEQALPLRSWGKKFVVTQSNTRRRDYVKIVSATDDNKVRKNGEVVATLQTGEAHGFYLTSSEKSCYLETDGASAVYLYNTTSSDGKGTGDPSMLWISPIEQRLNEITLATFSGDAAHNSSITYHYINIIVATEDINKVLFDGEQLAESEFTTVEGNADYSFARKSISYDSHQLSCVNGFNAHVYGFGSDRGYAYMVGSKAADLTTSIFINEVLTLPFDTISDCTLDPFTFQAEINLGDHTLEWDFGDGTTSQGNPVVHTYTSHKLYEVTLTVNTSQGPCSGSASGKSYTFYVNLGGVSEEETVYDDTHCDSIVWNNKTYYKSGIYTDTIPNEEGCYTLLQLNFDLDFSPDPTEIFPVDPANTAPHWVATATEFQINSYDFTLAERNEECHWDSVRWTIESTNAHWVLEVDTTSGHIGEVCRVYVLNHVPDTVWLTAKVYNGCVGDNIPERRFWLVSSFYDIDENASSTHLGTIDVVPNPNNGQMRIEGVGSSGEIGVKVYDMRGILVDSFKLPATTGPYSIDYQCASKHDGLHLFVFDMGGKTVTKKVIINR